MIPGAGKMKGKLKTKEVRKKMGKRRDNDHNTVVKGMMKEKQKTLERGNIFKKGVGGGAGMRGGRSEGSESVDKDMESILSDPRFAHVSEDLRLRRVPRQERRVKLDSRFQTMLTDDKFYEKSIMDPRGRKGHYSTKEDLRKFYQFSSEEDSDSDDEEDKDEEEEEDERKESAGSGSDEEAEDKETGKEDARIDIDRTDESTDTEAEGMKRVEDMDLDYARGIVLFSDDSSDDDSTTTDEDLPEFEWGELDQDAVWNVGDTEVEETSRFAVCNLDWDRVKAVDIMILLSSFCPVGGSVQRVSIYPSEYGRERMAEEDRHGPLELRTTTNSCTDMNLVNLEKLEKGRLDMDAGASKKDFEILRQYQRNRLRYYYAVVECNTIDTAQTIYQECDRKQYEGAGIRLDLRYIPSDMTFDETPHDVCHKVPEKYEAKIFITSALTESKPVLTWDETDPERAKAITAAMTWAEKGQEVDEDRFKGLMASSSEGEVDDIPSHDIVESDSDSDGDEVTKAERIARFRALLSEIDEKERQKKERDIDLEETFTLGEDEGEKDSNNDVSDVDKEEEDTGGENDKAADTLTPFEKYLKKRKDKIKDRRKRQKEEKKKPTERDTSSEDSEDADGEMSDDELPDNAGDDYSDPFFAEELKKMNGEKEKMKKKVKKKSSKEAKKQGNLELLLMDEATDDKKHFSMREIIESNKGPKKVRVKGKVKKKKLESLQQEREKLLADNFKVDLSDPRFGSLMTSGEFNIDPSHPQFKRTRAMNDLINEVQRKRITQSFEVLPHSKRSCLEDSRTQELTTLVKNVKSKTKKNITLVNS